MNDYNDYSESETAADMVLGTKLSARNIVGGRSDNTTVKYREKRDKVSFVDNCDAVREANADLFLSKPRALSRRRHSS